MTQPGVPPWQQRITAALTFTVYADSLTAGQAAPCHAVAQMFTLADHLAGGGDLDEDRLAAELAAREWAEPDDSAISGTQQILAAIAAGAAWWQAAPAHRDGQGSWGSDAAVRAGAAGLLPGTATGAVAQLARRSATVTHTHCDARDAAAVHAAAVALACANNDFDDIDADKFLEVLAAQCRGVVMGSQLHLVRRLARDRATASEAAAVLGCGRSAAGAVSAALTAHLRWPRQPAQAIAWAHQMGAAWRAAAVMAATSGGARNPHARPPITWALPPALRAQISTSAAGLAASPPPVLGHHRNVASRGSLTPRQHASHPQTADRLLASAAELSHNCHNTAGTSPYRPGNVARAEDGRTEHAKGQR